MKRDKMKLEDILRLPPGSREEMKRALERVEEQMRSNTARRDTAGSDEAAPLSSNGYRWTRTALFAAATVLLVAVLAQVVWESTVFGVLNTPDGGFQWVFNESAFGNEGGILTLRDESRVEIREMSNLSLHRAADGVRIHLTRGEVIVNTAKQREGHLYVQTKDMMVSVMGTVFVVSAEAAGSRVAVFEGDVQLKQGTTETQLRPGDDVFSNPNMDALPVREEISWSRHVEQHLALLDQARTSTIPNAQTPDEPEWQKAAGGKMSFETATVRASYERDPGAFPLGIDNIYRSTGGVFKASLPLRIYVEFAYKLSLTPAQRESWLSQAPKWVASDNFAINAKAPTSNPTKDQMRLMMQSLLAERFKLAVRFERKQMPAFVLTLVRPGRLGPQIWPHAEGPPCPAKSDSDLYPRDINAEVWPYHCDTVVLIGPGVAVERLRPANKSSVNSQLFGGRNVSMEIMLDAFIRSGTGIVNPLVNQTGLTGDFDFTLEWIPDDPEAAFPEAMKEQLGMKLEATKAFIPTLVIDQVEKPSEN
jgi:uncharacterized protein (TIGR03435 family)